MNVEKAVFVDVDVADVACEGCGLTAAHAHCDKCFRHLCEEAGEEAIATYSPPEDESREEAASRVRGWLTTERAKPATDITPEVAALFERCAEDLEVG